MFCWGRGFILVVIIYRLYFLKSLFFNINYGVKFVFSLVLRFMKRLEYRGEKLWKMGFLEVEASRFSVYVCLFYLYFCFGWGSI